MAGATVTVQVAKQKGGAFKAQFDGTELGGLTRDGITMRFAEQWIDVENDHLGAGPVKRISDGATLEFSFTLLEFDFTFLRYFLPMSVRTINTTPSREKLEWPKVQSGERELTGRTLLLHPVGLPDATVTDDITIKGEFTGGVEVTLGGGSTRGFAVNGIGIHDTDNVGRYITVGDTATTGTGT